MAAGERDRPRKRDRFKAGMKRFTEVPLSIRTSDLPKRAASGLVMVAVSVCALWIGGFWLDMFIVAVGIVTYAEFARLIYRMEISGMARALGWLAGVIYVGTATTILVRAQSQEVLVLIVGCVICVDTFAYAFGRTLGGPKIAPAISPSKTWAGLLGGVVGATLALILFQVFSASGSAVAYRPPVEWLALVVPGALVAIVAQAGDFLESFLKRKARMKDSSNLIPGHGGVFDRTDGILPVAILFGGVLSVLAPHWIGL